MGTVIACALAAPLLLLLRRRRFAIDVPKVLVPTIALTLLVTTGVIGLLLGGSDDPGLFVVLVVLGAPAVATPIAAVTATSIAGVSGYGLAAALMAFAGWALGLVVMVFLEPQTHDFTALLAMFAVPSSYAGTCAVYAAALGKRT